VLAAVRSKADIFDYIETFYIRVCRHSYLRWVSHEVLEAA